MRQLLALLVLLGLIVPAFSAPAARKSSDWEGFRQRLEDLPRPASQDDLWRFVAAVNDLVAQYFPAYGVGDPVDGYTANVDSNRRLEVYIGGSASGVGMQVQGNVSHGAADSGNPVKIGGKANSAAPANVAADNRVDAWFGLAGQQVIGGYDGAAVRTVKTDATGALQVDVENVVSSNISQVGGAAFAQGQRSTAGSLSVTLSSDHSAVTVAQSTPANLQATVTPASGSVFTSNPNAVASGTYGSVSVGTTATQIVASNANRKWLLIVNNGGADVFLGFNNSVTTSNGLLLKSGGGSISLGEGGTIYTGAVYGIVSAGSVDVRYMEY